MVEDNAALLGVLRFNLVRSGFRVDVAENGRIAWDTLTDSQSGYDLIITDHQMPEMTGLELCDRLRKMESYRSVPIILLTAKRLELDIEEVQKQFGLSAIYPKPFSPNKIVEQVQDLIASVN